MKLNQLKEEAIKGNLILHKYGRNFTRNQYIYSKEENVEDSKLITIKKVNYKRYFYFCRTKDMPEHINYKINAKDYKLFLSMGIKEY